MLSLASYFEPSELERVMPLLFPADKGMRPPNVVPYAYAPHRAAASGVPVSWPFACLHLCAFAFVRVLLAGWTSPSNSLRSV